MKKTILISTIAATGLFADMLTDMAMDAAKSEAKTEVRSQAVKHIAGDDAVKKDLVNKGADQVLGKENPVDKVKSDALGAVTGSSTSVEDKVVDTAVEKAVGSNPLHKTVAKEAVKSAL